ncbi:transient receptor potential channel pyrexia-like isoform X1 [Macrobrachium nipponense]|uniref:transient receptor potential channel pyrexia-like isoform X1 n=1 Tax=Macrobrachium nipponense TaxID=159736 RepID=UPI0030C89B4E
MCSTEETKREELCEALEKGDVSTSSTILKEFTNVPFKQGEQPLLCIAVNAPYNCTRLVSLLLKAQTPITASDPLGATALHYAARRSCFKCLVLLVKSKADVHQRDLEGRVPLHYATLSRSSGTPKCVQLLLDEGSLCNVSDKKDRTPLHFAAQFGNVIATKVLLKFGASTTNIDDSGRTPLSLATVPEVARLLLDAGAEVTTVDIKSGETVLEKAIKHKPSLVPTLMASGITIRGDIGDRDLRVFFNLEILCDSNQCETKLIQSMVRRGYNEFLKYPLCESFIHLKWIRVAPLFYLKLTVFLTLVLTLTVDLCLRSVLTGHEDVNSSNATHNNNSTVQDHNILVITETLKYFSGVILILLILCVLFQMVILKLTYWRRGEKLLELIFVICALFLNRMHGPLDTWERHVAVYAMIIGWGEITVLVGHIPSVGIYVEMFKKVSVRMLTFACVYSSLFIGFSVSFYLVFEGEVFSTIWMSVLKTLAMMVGELEVSSILGKDTEQTLPGTAHVIFVLFVLLMTIVITNLLVGLAVQDIQMLQKEAGVSRLALTVEQETSVDIMLSSRLVSWIMPYQLHTWLRNKCSLLHHLPQRSLHVPNACNQISDSDASVDWWIRQGTRSQQRGPMEHYNIFIRPYDPAKPGKVYFSNVTKLIPTSYTLPDWIVRNTKLLIENGLHNRESGADLVTDDGEEEAEDTDTTNEIQSTTLENMQEQLNELQKSVTVMSQMMKKILNSK